VPVLNFSTGNDGGAGSNMTLKTRIAHSHSTQNDTADATFKTFVRNPNSRVMNRQTSGDSGESQTSGLMASLRRTNPLASSQAAQEMEGEFDWSTNGGTIAETSMDGGVNAAGRPPSHQFPPEFVANSVVTKPMGNRHNTDWTHSQRRSSDFGGAEAEIIMQTSPIASPTKLEPRNLPGVGSFPFERALSSGSAYDEHNDSTDEEVPAAPIGSIDKTTGVNLAQHFAGIKAGYAANDPTTDEDGSDHEALPPPPPEEDDDGEKGGDAVIAPTAGNVVHNEEEYANFESALVALGGGKAAIAAKKKKKGIRGRNDDHQVTKRPGDRVGGVGGGGGRAGAGIRPRTASNQATRRGRDEDGGSGSGGGGRGNTASQLGRELDAVDYRNDKQINSTGADEVIASPRDDAGGYVYSNTVNNGSSAEVPVYAVPSDAGLLLGQELDVASLSPSDLALPYSEFTPKNLKVPITREFKPTIAAKPLVGRGIRPRTASNQATKRYDEKDRVAKLPPGTKSPKRPTPAPRPRMGRRRSSLTGVEIAGLAAAPTTVANMGNRRQSLCEEV